MLYGRLQGDVRAAAPGAYVRTYPCGCAFGTLPSDTHFDEIVERHRPQV
jgi:hypothetical protein